jgi:hypothetical protein
MDLKKLQQEAEDLKQINITALSAEQLEQLVEKLSKMLDINDTFLEETKSQIEELNIEEDESNDDQ